MTKNIWSAVTNIPLNPGVGLEGCIFPSVVRYRRTSPKSNIYTTPESSDERPMAKLAKFTNTFIIRRKF